MITVSTTRARRNCGGHFQLVIDIGVQKHDGKRGYAGVSGAGGSFCSKPDMPDLTFKTATV